MADVWNEVGKRQAGIEGQDDLRRAANSIDPSCLRDQGYCATLRCLRHDVSNHGMAEEFIRIVRMKHHGQANPNTVGHVCLLTWSH